MQVGMIGLGRMGANMVRRLMRGGHACVVYDRSTEAVSALAQEGARWASVRGATSGTQKATAAQVQSFVRSRALGLTVSVTTSADPQSLAPGDVITVSVQNTLPPFTRLLPSSSLTMGSTARMIIQR